MHPNSIQEARQAVAWLRSQPAPNPIPVAELESYAAEEQDRLTGHIEEWDVWAARADELLRSMPPAVSSVGVLKASGVEGCVLVKSAHPREVAEHWLVSVVGYADAVAAGLRRAVALAEERHRAELVRAGGSPS